MKNSTLIPSRLKPWLPYVVGVLLLIDVLLLIAEGAKTSEHATAFKPIYLSNFAPYLLLSAMVGDVWAIVVGIKQLLRRRLVGLAFLAVSGLSGYAVMGQLLTVLVGFRDAGSLVAGDGHEYHLLIEGFLQGYQMNIAVKTRSSPLGTWYSVVAVGPGDQNWDHLKADKPVFDEETLTRTTDGIVLGMAGTSAYVGFDPNLQIAYGQTSGVSDMWASSEHSIMGLSGKKLVNSEATLIRSPMVTGSAPY